MKVMTHYRTNGLTFIRVDIGVTNKTRMDANDFYTESVRSAIAPRNYRNYAVYSLYGVYFGNAMHHLVSEAIFIGRVKVRMVKRV